MRNEFVMQTDRPYAIRMHRIVRARLDADTIALLARLRRETGLTDSEILGRAVRRLAEDLAPDRRKQIIGVGRFASGRSDLASNTRYLTGLGVS